MNIFTDDPPDTFRLTMEVEDIFGEWVDIDVTPDDVARYYATQSWKLGSGCRTLAGFTSDWRHVDRIANCILEYFKGECIDVMRDAAREHGLTPKF